MSPIPSDETVIDDRRSRSHQSVLSHSTGAVEPKRHEERSLSLPDSGEVGHNRPGPVGDVADAPGESRGTSSGRSQVALPGPDPFDALLADDRLGFGRRVQMARDRLAMQPPSTWLIGIVIVAIVGGMSLVAIKVGMAGPTGGAGPATIELPYAAPVPAGSQGVTATPDSSSTTEPPPDVMVHMAGAVKAPGVYRIAAGGRVVDALAAAGGMTADADIERVNLAAALEDGQRWYVPRIGETDGPTIIQPERGGVGTAASGTAVPGSTNEPGTPLAPIDLNAATAEQLESLPGVGPAIASAIVRQRDEVGSFSSVDDLLDVPGIGEGRLSNWRDLLVVK